MSALKKVNPRPSFLTTLISQHTFNNVTVNYKIYRMYDREMGMYLIWAGCEIFFFVQGNWMMHYLNGLHLSTM